ncbi:MAG: ATP-binding cassette domain-containing protein [Halobacteriovoraceae bacterium]|nr:ATP-binding cassette domain-containing protein [Halobacteriovoraceae bacterium]MCB9095691.1 ATP-binding cassette domain-containing protein [Halobacteriovoraceae bacterium]
MKSFFELNKSKFIELPTGVWRESLHLKRGEGVGVTGENGIGKSSLIQYFKNHQKEIFENEFLSFLDQAVLDPLVNLSVQEILNLANSELTGRLPEKLNAENSLIQKFSFSKHISKNYSFLSGGEKRILQIILALGIDFIWGFLDEPTHQLSTQNTEKLITVIKQKKEQGVGFFIVDHNKDFLKSVCERVFQMEVSDKSVRLVNGNF